MTANCGCETRGNPCVTCELNTTIIDYDQYAWTAHKGLQIPCWRNQSRVWLAAHALTTVNSPHRTHFVQLKNPG
jgi:hypothetical protein